VNLDGALIIERSTSDSNQSVRLLLAGKFVTAKNWIIPEEQLPNDFLI
jgi:hypothetical protein